MPFVEPPLSSDTLEPKSWLLSVKGDGIGVESPELRERVLSEGEVRLDCR